VAGETWNLPWLNYADALAGLSVAAVILWVARSLADARWMLAGRGAQGLQQNRKAVAGWMGAGCRSGARAAPGNRHFVDATVSVRAPRA